MPQFSHLCSRDGPRSCSLAVVDFLGVMPGLWMVPTRHTLPLPTRGVCRCSGHGLGLLLACPLPVLSPIMGPGRALGCALKRRPPSCPLRREKTGGLFFRRCLDPLHRSLSRVACGPPAPHLALAGPPEPLPSSPTGPTHSLQTGQPRGVCSRSPLHQLPTSRVTAARAPWAPAASWGARARPLPLEPPT